MVKCTGACLAQEIMLVSSHLNACESPYSSWTCSTSGVFLRQRSYTLCTCDDKLTVEIILEKAHDFMGEVNVIYL
jgi:hypothetical protein